jgi:hypothetical protein
VKRPPLMGRIADRFGWVEPRPAVRDYLQGLLSGIECKPVGTWPSVPVRRRCSACCAPHVRRLPIRHVAPQRDTRCPGCGIGRFAVESVAVEFQLTGEKSEGQTVGALDLTNA